MKGKEKKGMFSPFPRLEKGDVYGEAIGVDGEVFILHFEDSSSMLQEGENVINPRFKGYHLEMLQRVSSVYENENRTDPTVLELYDRDCGKIEYIVVFSRIMRAGVVDDGSYVGHYLVRFMDPARMAQESPAFKRHYELTKGSGIRTTSFPLRPILDTVTDSVIRTFPCTTWTAQDSQYFH